MATIHLGQSGVISGQYGLEFGPQGFGYRIRKVGLHSEILALAQTLQSAGWVGSTSPIGESPKSELVATYAASGDPDNPSADVATTWELDVQMSNVPPMESEAYITWRDANYATSSERAALDYLMGVKYEDLPGGTFSGWDATRQAWYNTIQAQKPVQEMRSVLTKISVYPHGTSFAGDWADIGKIWTTSQIEATETVDERLGSLPTAYWLKCPAQAQVEENGRFTVVTRWVAGHYESHMYTFKT
jgi:hypothetical protein